MKSNPLLIDLILQSTGAMAVAQTSPIQTLWSGYGEIVRVNLVHDRATSGQPATVILKHVSPPFSQGVSGGQRGLGGSSHPRGWNTCGSHDRKLLSYEVESTWYREFSARCDDACRVPHCYAARSLDGQWAFVLEDLDAAGFASRRSSLDREGVFVGLKWLAHFHAVFLHDSLAGLWPMGTYWHLATRRDEWHAMEPGALKDAAEAIDAKLNACRFLTAVHGDAKVANFCFTGDGTRAAAVDFQYVGTGCGMKDVAYFLSSCLSESECERGESDYLDCYFQALRQSLLSTGKEVDVEALELEWRAMYPFAWADFTRFLLGWCPGHHKLNRYSRRITADVLKTCG
ncbi:Phosphotransferase enzyme family protein [Novipirellula galeiformis]|uniref:Phosphotransferase enzyme family protein n=1 Tax=Novipirellula galeiformis TaxID=2528004 RepID=A0A5C6CFT3_9BACT|nr:oxidoreductase family protein [Novipirellula galeiformis]TWU22106.1 Phosphotransferase enzyme family protein [Novipirellula galeiformis]